MAVNCKSCKTKCGYIEVMLFEGISIITFLIILIDIPKHMLFAYKKSTVLIFIVKAYTILYSCVDIFQYFIFKKQ